MVAPVRRALTRRRLPLAALALITLLLANSVYRLRDAGLVRRPLSAALRLSARLWDGKTQPIAAPCQPKRRIVFVKTHKTGSSTVTTMLERYGHTRGLNFALPGRSHVFSQFQKFRAEKAHLYGLEDGNGSRVLPALGGYHILANHARYNRPEQDALIPGAFYFTIIREPASQLESAFNFFRMARYVPYGNLTGVFRTEAERFNKSSEARPMGFLRNGQLYDLGLEQTSQNGEAVEAKVRALDREMDLVMIMEHFDESLVLLRKQLCWKLDDIVYISQLVRKNGSRTGLTTELTGQIHAWNHGDVRLYRHFNATLWEKVRAYGPGFKRDLAAFRELRENTTRTCLAGARVVFEQLHSTGQYNMAANASVQCRDLVRLDRSWVSVLRRDLDRRVAAFLDRQRAAINGTKP